jgi:hypothetical protein
MHGLAEFWRLLILLFGFSVICLAGLVWSSYRTMWGRLGRRVPLRLRFLVSGIILLSVSEIGEQFARLKAKTSPTWHLPVLTAAFPLLLTSMALYIVEATKFGRRKGDDPNEPR